MNKTAAMKLLVFGLFLALSLGAKPEFASAGGQCCVPPAQLCADETCKEDCNSLCGNGSVDPGEPCDDGNLVDNDACSNHCQVTACGNEIVDLSEDCDEGASNGPFGECSTTCRFNAECGNGTIEGLEECDEGSLNGTSESSCKTNCRYAIAPYEGYCGDLITQSGREDCDDGNARNGDGCSEDCKTEPGACAVTLEPSPMMIKVGNSGVLEASINCPQFQDDTYEFSVLSGAGYIEDVTMPPNQIQITCLRAGGSFVILATGQDSRKSARAEVSCQGGDSCFLPGTLIEMADGSQKPVEVLNAGDSVKGFDPKTEKFHVNKITELKVPRQVSEYYEIETVSGKVQVTGEHPFFVGEEQYKKVEELKVGEEIVYLKGDTAVREKILKKELIQKTVTVHNFTTDHTNNYIANSILVHNKSPFECKSWKLGGPVMCKAKSDCVKCHSENLGSREQDGTNYGCQTEECCCMDPICGDGIKDRAEECDDGANNGLPQFSPCGTDCKLMGVCGNKKVESGEDCDFGDTDSGDGCSSICKLEIGCSNDDAACNDGDECTADSCKEGFCANEFKDGCQKPCQDPAMSCMTPQKCDQLRNGTGSFGTGGQVGELCSGPNSTNICCKDTKCGSDSDCTGGSLCTTVSCNKNTGQCVSAPIPGCVPPPNPPDTPDVDPPSEDPPVVNPPPQNPPVAPGCAGMDEGRGQCIGNAFLQQANGLQFGRMDCTGWDVQVQIPDPMFVGDKGDGIILASMKTCGSFGVCGDGVTRGLETCDDGNTVNLDGCSSRCRIETQEEINEAMCGNFAYIGCASGSVCMQGGGHTVTAQCQSSPSQGSQTGCCLPKNCSGLGGGHDWECGSMDTTNTNPGMSAPAWSFIHLYSGHTRSGTCSYGAGGVYKQKQCAYRFT